MKNKPSRADIITWQTYRANSNKKTAAKIDHHFDRELFELGTQWSLSGKKIDEARPEVQNNKSFINGFERGERLKKINELDSPSKTR